VVRRRLDEEKISIGTETGRGKYKGGNGRLAQIGRGWLWSNQRAESPIVF